MKMPDQTDRISPNRLVVQPGRGDSFTCFAGRAVAVWNENICPFVQRSSRQRRREAWQMAADTAFITPIQAAQIVRHMKFVARAQAQAA